MFRCSCQGVVGIDALDWLGEGERMVFSLSGTPVLKVAFYATIEALTAGDAQEVEEAS